MDIKGFVNCRFLNSAIVDDAFKNYTYEQDDRATLTEFCKHITEILEEETGDNAEYMI